MKLTTPMSCRRHARITFSSMPLLSAWVALCSRCAVDAKRSLKKSISVGLSGILGRRGSAPMRNSLPGCLACSAAPPSISTLPSAMPNRTDLVAIFSLSSCINCSSSSSARSDRVMGLAWWCCMAGLFCFGRPEVTPGPRTAEPQSQRSPAAPGPGLRHGFDRVDDRLIPRAAAVVSRQVLADRLARRHAAAAQQLLRGQQHARRAVAALQRVAPLERVLQVGDLARIGDAFDGLHARAVALGGERQAAAHDDAVEAHRARPAHAVLAPDVAAGEPEVVAQEVDQRPTRLHGLAHLLAVHGEHDIDGRSAHDASRSCAATRRSSTPARCRFTVADACTSSVGLRSPASAVTASSTLPDASAASALRARTGVAPTPKKASRTSRSAVPSASALAASPTMA